MYDRLFLQGLDLFVKSIIDDIEVTSRDMCPHHLLGRYSFYFSSSYQPRVVEVIHFELLCNEPPINDLSGAINQP